MPVSVGQLIRMKFYCFMDEQLGINQLHYQVTNITGTGLELEEIAELMSLRVSDEYKALLTNDAAYRGASAQTIYPGAASTVYYDNSGAGSGTGGTEPMPKQVAGIVSWKTALAGQAQRGRSYVPFPDETDNEGFGKPTDDYVERLGEWADKVTGTITLVSSPNTMDMRQVVVGASINLGKFVTSFVAKPNWATQRRRGDFGAKNTSPI